MIEIRIHGRGGQGAVIASQILAQAAFREGMHVQAFPAFGSERRGAAVTAFLRLHGFSYLGTLGGVQAERAHNPRPEPYRTEISQCNRRD